MPRKDGAAEASGDSGFSQSFEVVVVRVIDDFAVVVGFVGGKDSLQGAQAGAGPAMVEKDAPGVLTHGGALAAGYFERLQGGEAVENLFHSEPGNQQERKEQDEPAGENVLSATAAQQRSSGREHQPLRRN